MVKNKRKDNTKKKKIIISRAFYVYKMYLLLLYFSSFNADVMQKQLYHIYTLHYSIFHVLKHVFHEDLIENLNLDRLMEI